MDLKEKTALKLAKLRKDQGLTQAEMSRITGISAANISRIEHGKQNLSLDTIESYCAAFQCFADIQVGEECVSSEENTEYSLLFFDDRLLSFNMVRKGLDIEVEITWVNRDAKKYFPAALEAENSSLRSWLKRRPLPIGRAYASELLQSMGLKKRDIKGLIDLSKCLSLEDCYWVLPTKFRPDFSKYNLFDNSFSSQAGEIAFMGMAQPLQDFCSSPEFTTGGTLRKAWRRPLGKEGIWLYKGGSIGDSGNEGNEVFSEYYAAQVAEAMGLKRVSYNLEMWRGVLTCCCPIFTGKDISFVPAGEIPGIFEIEDVLDCYKALGMRFFDELCDMFVFDALVCNPDRHFNNFGLLRDNRTGEFVSPAPIFDNGLALFPAACRYDFEHLEEIAEKANPPYERTWDEILSYALTKRQKEELKKIRTFRFTEHPHFNWPEWRLKALEDFLHKRTERFLKS